MLPPTLLIGQFLAGPFASSVYHWYKLESNDDNALPCIFFFHFDDPESVDGPEFFTGISQKLSEFPFCVNSEIVDEIMLESKDRTVIVVDQKSEFTGMHVINEKEKYGSPLRIYTSPLFIIGYSDKLNKWDTLRAIFQP
eukprot:UN05522